MSGSWTVGEVAALARVTVRTLHHYDEVGLLVPARRSAAGYRLYAPEDLERLYRIRLFRELGFSLEAIGALLDAPIPERRAALRAQRELLGEKIRRTEAVARAVDRALETLETGGHVDVEAMFEGMDEFVDPDLAEEAKDRWGDTEAYRESMRRMKSFTKDDWTRMREEGEAVESDMAALMRAGEEPDGEAAMDVAERARAHIDRWFYPCDHAMHARLAAMYEADPRFRSHYEERAEGLAAFHARAIRANAARAGAGESGP